MADLSVSNFISKIKQMSDRERNKIRKEELINLIIQLPGDFNQNCSSAIEDKFSDLTASIDFIKSQTMNNATEIALQKNQNKELQLENESLKEEISALKSDITSCKDKLSDHQSHLDSIEQYLRINNVEIVGLPAANSEGDPIEQELLNIFNDLPGLPKPITADDIDICHVLPSKRNDKKLVAVCKFVHRKTKYAVLQSKKNCKDFKYKNNSIFINDHLSPFKRSLFALASQKKKELNFKYLWSRDCNIYMRENEHSPVISIINEDCLDNLSRQNSFFENK